MKKSDQTALCAWRGRNACQLLVPKTEVDLLRMLFLPQEVLDIINSTSPQNTQSASASAVANVSSIEKSETINETKEGCDECAGQKRKRDDEEEKKE